MVVSDNNSEHFPPLRQKETQYGARAVSYSESVIQTPGSLPLLPCEHPCCQTPNFLLPNNNTGNPLKSLCNFCRSRPPHPNGSAVFFLAHTANNVVPGNAFGRKSPTQNVLTECSGNASENVHERSRACVQISYLIFAHCCCAVFLYLQWR